jgi:hypothetical protein
MKSYSELEIFTEKEVRLFHVATQLVEALPRPPKLRCHELARALGCILGLQHQDGYYGFVDHSWLWTTKPEWNTLTERTRLGFPNILDVYSVGSLPMVRLVDGKHPSLPHVGWAYRPGKLREDIDQVAVNDLVNEFTRHHER